MKKDCSRKPWSPPKLDELRVADTAVKGNNDNESINTNMFMTPMGMQS